MVEGYIQGITSERIPSNRYARLAVERHLKDLDRQNTNDFPYYFNEEDAQYVLDVFGVLKYTKGKWRGNPFVLMPFWAFILWCCFGWKEVGTNKRRFRKVYIKVPRKNAKTEVLIGIGTYMLAFDGEQDPEIYWFATKKDQAKIGWDRQKVMVDRLRHDSSTFYSKYDTTKYRIFTTEGLGFVAYLGRDSKMEDGSAPSCGIGDEYHAHPTDDMINVIEDGMGSRSQPMMWLITTAGYNPFSPCAQFEKLGEQILDGVIDAENMFFMMFGVDDGDDWEDPEVWRKANPAYDHIDTLPGFLKAQYELAKAQGGSKLTSFLTKNLNRWVSSHSAWISDDIYQKSRSPIDLSFLEGKECVGGLDLSAKRDITGLTLFFPQQSGLDKPYLLRFAWIPEDEATDRQRKDAVPYLKWAEDGFLFLTPGNAIDYDYIYQTITGLYDTNISRERPETLYDGVGLINRFKILRIAYDRYREEQIVTKLIDTGVNMAPFGQGYRSMSVPVDDLEVMYLKELLEHDGNPVARFCYSNVRMNSDPAGNRKPDKDKSKEKIDLVVTDIMAFGEWLGKKPEEKESVYSQRGIRTL